MGRAATYQSACNRELIPQQDTRDAVLIRNWSCAASVWRRMVAPTWVNILGDRLYETGLNRVLHDRDPAIRASAEE